MNKGDLINSMAKDASLSKAASERALNAFLTAVHGSLSKGTRVTIPGFGTFAVSKRKARVGRNPQTGAKITIPARTVPVFRAGKGLKAAC
ncbi:MAG: DNA-binding protein HU [Candidatus Abawacabacteria bacterium RIFCSPHIGHO2_01_FULL_46_8]|uniref:DNA-binding protein HU n=1 Tax=Candidatus Abawacabacteria bacterium RIFCSPHIGHO2_01_FULL_46_8 TaxID=1817815 RepID=A0A1F4XJZ2_9BACT|nr:MAG: DNA-binding protein HU [Candidatus Abawacabacteria bacterium RIFCSPHIGHO2_01_FULL_46_8]